jgi:hypothetical protein
MKQTTRERKIKSTRKKLKEEKKEK